MDKQCVFISAYFSEGGRGAKKKKKLTGRAGRKHKKGGRDQSVDRGAAEERNGAELRPAEQRPLEQGPAHAHEL